jgi:LmbE family N-acetylglucosaminyl deacetylase
MRILVVSTHPDDEILGSGGALIRHQQQGDDLAWLIVTNIYERQGFDPETIEDRQQEIQTVAEYLDAKVYKFGYPSMELHSKHLIELPQKVSQVFNDFKPERIYVMNRSDAHSDHRVAFDAIMTCTKSFRYPFIREVLMYECISETEFAPSLPEKAFQPNCFIDITNEMDKKIEIINTYESEMGEHPFPRSERNIRALATFRGATAGVEYAEAFQIIKSFRFETL